MNQDLTSFPTFIVHLERQPTRKDHTGELIPGASHMVVLQAANEQNAVEMALLNTRMHVADEHVKVQVNAMSAPELDNLSKK